MKTIYSWNVNGIRAVQKKGFLEWLYTTKPDVLCLQETKAWAEQLDEALVSPKVYNVVFAEAAKKGYSGTAIYSKQKPLNVIIGLPDDIKAKYDFTDKYGDTSDEGRVLTAEFETYYVSTVYTPNSKGDLTRLSMRDKNWDPAYLEYMQRLEETKPVIYCGDLNVAHTEDDLARPKDNKGKHGFTDEERKGFDNMLAAGFVDTFRMFTQGNGHYSWWTAWGNTRERNVGWRIDYVMVSKALKDKVKAAKIHPDVMGSDHCPVSIEIDL